MSPLYTLIIPVPEFRPDWPILLALAEYPPPRDTQYLIVAGHHPARQRNEALVLSAGEIIVFFDSDSVIEEAYWSRLNAAVSKKNVEVVGGPSLLRREASWWEQIFQVLLAHGLVVGPIAARYGSFGDFRASSQSELILCNLAVRRTVFERIGLFSPELFPNEENEWLDRAQATEVGIFYDPTLFVRRPQRADLGTFLKTMIRYGVGRTHQLKVSRKLTLHQILPMVGLFFLFAFSFYLGLFMGWFLAVLWILASVVIFLGSPPEVPLNIRLIAGALGPLVPICYIFGQIQGFFVKGSGLTETPILVMNEHGQALTAATEEVV